MITEIAIYVLIGAANYIAMLVNSPDEDDFSDHVIMVVYSAIWPFSVITVLLTRLWRRR